MAKSHARDKTFSPVPARAMADVDLTAQELRILMALAAHDRFGANGIGCYASHKRLADLVRCHVKSLSRSLNLLGERGYVEARPHPLMKRLRVYRVLYTAEDAAIMGRSIGSEPVTDGDAEEPNGAPIGNEPVPGAEAIGNRDFDEAERFQGDAHAEYILRSNVRYPAEAGKHTTTEVASPCGAAMPRCEEDELQRQGADGAFLAQTHRQLKALNGSELTSAEVGDLRKLWSRCEDIEERRSHDRDAVHFWAQRLATEIGARIEQWEPAF